MVGKPLVHTMLLWGLWIVLGLCQSSSSPGVFLFVRADNAGDVEEAPLRGEHEEQEPQVCVPAHPVDCSKHERTIRELTDSVEALQSKVREGASSNADAAQKECQVQVQQTRADHQAKLDEVEAKLASALASRQDDAQKEEALLQLQRSLEMLQAQYDASVRDREQLSAQLENTTTQLQQLLDDHEAQIRANRELRAVEDRAARAHEAHSKRTSELRSELKDAQTRLDRSQQDLFEARQELHDVWEKYVGIRDAWWNVPTRYYALEKWCWRQWRRIDDQVTRYRAAAKPHLDKVGRVVATTVLAVHQKVALVIDFVERVTFDWFLPKWRRHVQPHVNRMGHLLAEQAVKLSLLAKEYGLVAWEWAGHQWSEFSRASAPQREKIMDLIQPTVDMVHAQFAPAASALQGAWKAAQTAMEESTALESAARALHQTEVRIVSWIAAASGVAHGYLVLQNVPTAATESLQWIHQSATSHVAAATKLPWTYSGAPFLLRSVALAAGATGAMLGTILWALLFYRRSNTPPRRQQPTSSTTSPSKSSPRRSPQKVDAPKPLRPKPSSPDLVTEASSTSVPGASSVRTTGTGTAHR